MNPHLPPKWANKLLEWFCRKDLLEIIQGDLFEIHEKRITKKGKAYANALYLRDVLSLFRPFAFQLFRSHSNKIAMYKNYLKVAYRNLLRHKMYSFIKIGGLAMGIAACILISLFIREELSYDKGYKDADRIYRLVNVWDPPGDLQKWVAQQPPMLDAINNEMPEIEVATRIVPYGRMLAGENLFRRSDHVVNNYEEGFIYADASFLQVFDVEMIYGDAKTALTTPRSILLSKSKADKYFPDEDPVGKTMIFNDNSEAPYKIDGVIEDLSEDTHFEFDFVITLLGEELWPGEHKSWCCTNFDIYIKKKEEAKEASIIERLYNVRDTHIAKRMKRDSPAEMDMLKHRGFELQKIEDIHLYSEDISDGYNNQGDIKVIWMFGGIAILILLLACINFINLSTAKSANRAKEVGLRKVVGSNQGELVGQFLSESILFSLISLFLGLILAIAIVPYFNDIANKELVIPFTEWWFLPIVFGIAVMVGILAGIYPSFYMSAFKPIEVLKGKLRLGSKSTHLQNGMVVFQFIASIVLIIGAISVNRQMDFILNKKLGFDKEQVVLIEGTNTLGPKINTLKTELKKLSTVESVSVSAFLPLAGMGRDGNNFWLEGRSKEDKGVSAQLWRVDHEYIETLGLELIQGRNFDTKLVSDSASIIVNETMVRNFGFESPIGKRITNVYEYPRTIIGVVKDFHFESMKGEIEALNLVLGSQPEVTSIKVNSDNLMATMSDITEIWESIVPNQPIRYEFLDQRFAEMYTDVKRTGQIFTSFSILAILIACLGLFALSTFMIEQRRKEISVRKVLGASFGSLFHSLTSNFLKLVIVSLIISIPTGWYAMNKWLQNYKYKTELSWDIFLYSGIIILGIALITISYEIIRATRVNPADSLHSE